MPFHGLDFGLGGGLTGTLDEPEGEFGLEEREALGSRLPNVSLTEKTDVAELRIGYDEGRLLVRVRIDPVAIRHGPKWAVGGSGGVRIRGPCPPGIEGMR